MDKIGGRENMLATREDTSVFAGPAGGSQKDSKAASDSFQKAATKKSRSVDLKAVSEIMLKTRTEEDQRMEIAWHYKGDVNIRDRVVVGSDKTVYGLSYEGKAFAVDGSTGEEKWSSECEGWTSDPALGKDDILYVGTTSKKLYAIDGKTGKRLWTRQTSPYHNDSQTPEMPVAGPDGIVYVASDKGKILALDGKTGEQKWEFRTKNDRGIFSRATLGDDGSIYAGDYDGYVYALDGATGRKLWQVKAEFEIAYSSPVTDNQGKIFVMSSRHPDSMSLKYPRGGTKLTAISETKKRGFTGKEKRKAEKLWEIDLDGPSKSSPSIAKIGDKTIVYITTGDAKLRAIDGETGHELWSFVTEHKNTRVTTFGEDRRTPVVDEKHGQIHISSKDGILYTLDASSGKILGRHEFKFKIELDPSRSDDNPISMPSIDEEGSVYVSDIHGTLFAFKSPGIARIERDLANIQKASDNENPRIIYETDETVIIDGVKLDKRAS